MIASYPPVLPAPSHRLFPSSSLRPAVSVFLPKEHGSWSLALEPLMLGLLIAPSWAGGAFAGAVLAGFFSRRPLKAAFAPDHSRRLAAWASLGIWLAVALVGLSEAGVLGGWRPLGLLLLAAPFAAAFIWFDLRNDSRAQAAELAGCAAFAVVPMVTALLAGRSFTVALVLAVLVLARSIPAVMTVRWYLRTMKGQSAGAGPVIMVAGLACAVLVALAVAGLVPALVVALGILFFARTLWLVGPWRPVWPARRIGQCEAGLGLLYVVLLVFGWR